MTWKPSVGMTPKQTEKAVQRAAADFKRSIEQGFALDNKQTFAEYANYVLDLKLRTGTKLRTIERYKDMMARINQAIGHIKLADLRPQHLNSFYKNLAEPGTSAFPPACSIFSFADSEKAAALTVIFLVRVPFARTFRP